MKFHAAMGQRTLFNMGCTKRKREEGDGLPRELCTRLDPGPGLPPLPLGLWEVPGRLCQGVTEAGGAGKEA
eukprot:378579-Pelagomonas_calceolata.AAC.1